MPDKIEPKEGDKIKLIGPSSDIYTVLSVDKSKVTLRIKDSKGVNLRLHKSRILEIVKPEARALPAVAAVPGKEERKMTADVAVKEAPVKAKEEQVKAKVKKEKKKLTPFDVAAWVTANGGVHLTKSCSFDHQSTKLTAHVCVDEKGGFYHTINTYKYPDGTVSLGKNNKGGSKYPLKGHRLTFTANTEKGAEKKTLQGDCTAAGVVAKYEKNGYKLVAGKISAPQPVAAATE